VAAPNGTCREGGGVVLMRSKKLTSSEKLDEILAAAETPKIEDVVNVSHYRYVWSGAQFIQCGNWRIRTPTGLLSDGATSVPDRCPDAFFAHDSLFLSPFAYYKSVRKELSRRQCDKIYAQIGLRNCLLSVCFEGMAMAYLGISAPVWRKYRSRAKAGENLIESHIVPRAACWKFVTRYTRDAIWIGSKGGTLGVDAVCAEKD